MKRREFLIGGLTFAGLGWSGCRIKGTPPVVESLQGARRDPDFREGHRLRDRDFPTEPTEFESCDGVILGGGVAGLSAGWRWSADGFENYKLLELESEVGGNSRALNYPVTSAPIAAHYLPLPNLEAKAVRRVLEEMDVLYQESGVWRIRQEHLCHSRQERLFYQDDWQDGLVPRKVLGVESLAQLDHFRAHIDDWVGKRDAKGRKIFALPLQMSSQEPEYLALDRISFAEYSKRQGWTDPFLLWYLEYACRDDFGGSMKNCSAWAGLHYFSSRDGGGLGGADDIMVWPEGNNRLVQHLNSHQTGEVLTGALVLKVSRGKQGVVVDYLDTIRNVRKRLQCKVAVYCLPSFTRPYLMEEKQSVESFVYPPWVTANLSFDRMPNDLEPPGFVAWDNVIYGASSLGYVVATHQSLRTEPGLPTVWTWYRPFPDDPPAERRKRLLESNWQDWAEHILGELEPLHSDVRERCRRLDVTILGHGMIRPTVGFVWGEELSQARRSQPGIYFGHGDLSGMSLFEESQYRGVLAAEQALGYLQRKSESFL